MLINTRKAQHGWPKGRVVAQEKRFSSSLYLRKSAKRNALRNSCASRCPTQPPLKTLFEAALNPQQTRFHPHSKVPASILKQLFLTNGTHLLHSSMSDNFHPRFIALLPLSSSAPQAIPNTSTFRLETETESCPSGSCPRKRRRTVSSGTGAIEETDSPPPKIPRAGRRGRVLCGRCRQGRHGWQVLTYTPVQPNCISALKTVESIPVLVFNVKKTVSPLRNVAPKRFLKGNVRNENEQKSSCNRKYCF